MFRPEDAIVKGKLGNLFPLAANAIIGPLPDPKHLQFYLYPKSETLTPVLCLLGARERRFHHTSKMFTVMIQ